MWEGSSPELRFASMITFQIQTCSINCVTIINTFFQHRVDGVQCFKFAFDAIYFQFQLDVCIARNHLIAHCNAFSCATPPLLSPVFPIRPGKPSPFVISILHTHDKTAREQLNTHLTPTPPPIWLAPHSQFACCRVHADQFNLTLDMFEVRVSLNTHTDTPTHTCTHTNANHHALNPHIHVF